MCALTLAGTVGCATGPGWKPLPPPPATFAREHPARVRVTLTDGSRLTLTSPRLVSDTLCGRSDSGTGQSLVCIRVQGVRVIEQWRAQVGGRSHSRRDGLGDVGGERKAFGFLLLALVGIGLGGLLALAMSGWSIPVHIL